MFDAFCSQCIGIFFSRFANPKWCYLDYVVWSGKEKYAYSRFKKCFSLSSFRLKNFAHYCLHISNWFRPGLRLDKSNRNIFWSEPSYHSSGCMFRLSVLVEAASVSILLNALQCFCRIFLYIILSTFSSSLSLFHFGKKNLYSVVVVVMWLNVKSHKNPFSGLNIWISCVLSLLATVGPASC